MNIDLRIKALLWSLGVAALGGLQTREAASGGSPLDAALAGIAVMAALLWGAIAILEWWDS